MNKSRSHRRFAMALLLMAGFGLLVVGCSNGDVTSGDSSSLERNGSSQIVGSLTQVPSVVDAEQLSTFKSKDPFIQQNVEVSTTTTTTSGSSGGTTTTTSGSSGGTTTTTKYIPTTTTKYIPGTTTTTKPAPTTTTTAPHLHTLKILSVSEVGGAPAVTFQVDTSVYKDKRVGDVVSSSWGQIKVVDLNPTSKVATLLHGSETLVLSAGQLIYE